MATKTLVCPECGATAAPGRYACAECGSLLASVAVAPRNGTDRDLDDVVRPSHGGTERGSRRTRGRGSSSAARADAAAAPAAAGGATPTDEVSPVAEVSFPEPVASLLADAEAFPPDLPEADPGPAGNPASLAFDENAPIRSAVRGGFVPDVLHDLPDSTEPDEAAPASLGPAETAEPEVPALDDDAAPPPARPAFADVPTWPPAGDHGIVDRPAPRTPAGAYLPPSAVLPPLDAVAPAAAIASPVREPWSARTSAALADALDGVHLTTAGSRQAIVLGAGLAALGMLLPWINGPQNEGALAGYLNRWGLAGAGMWLVLLGLVALAFAAGSAKPGSRLPFGAVALASGAFVVGLLWPYLVGSVSRSVGVWVVLVGAVVLAVGGVLDRRDRHAPAGPDVPTVDNGAR